MALSPTWFEGTTRRIAYGLAGEAPPEEVELVKRIVYPHYGELVGRRVDIRYYDLSQVSVEDARDLAASYGYRVGYFGGQFGPPDFRNRGYAQGWLLIYDPFDPTGSFKDPEYTEIWRILHELAHALTQEDTDQAYGFGRRAGRLGDPLTIREATRACYWELLVWMLQRELSAEVGGKITDSDWYREGNTTMADAVIRAVTGVFSDPDLDGLVGYPKSVPWPASFELLTRFAQCLKAGVPMTRFV